MKTAIEVFEEKFPKHTRVLKEWALILMDEYASQFKSPSEMTDQIKKNIFFAGFKACEGGWNIQKAQKWFDETYRSELRKRMNNYVTTHDLKNDDETREEKIKDKNIELEKNKFTFETGV